MSGTLRIRAALAFFVLAAASAAGEGVFDHRVVDPEASVPETGVDVYQAEARSAQRASRERTRRGGFTGSGYMDLGVGGGGNRKRNSWIEWNDIHALRAGDYDLTFRYANGSSGATRAAVRVDGKKSGTLAFERTGGWGKWRTETLRVALRKGANRVRIRANTKKVGPNIDYVRVVASATIDLCPDDPDKVDPGACGCGVTVDDASGDCGDGTVRQRPRSLYAYSFGGIEDMDVDDAVRLLVTLGYVGIAAAARGDAALERLVEFQQSSERNDGEEKFHLVSGFVAHRFHRDGFSDANHVTVLDLLADGTTATGGDSQLWIWFRDDGGEVTESRLEQFVRPILDRAAAVGVKVVFYPHRGTMYETAEDALGFVERMDHPALGLAVHLSHELWAGRGDDLGRTFELVRHRLDAVTISGADAQIGAASNSSTNGGSAVGSLDESEVDLRPYMRLIRDSGFEGPVGFLNYGLSDPEDYLERSMRRWNELCREVGLYERAR